jgi:hypothetical protein
LKHRGDETQVSLGVIVIASKLDFAAERLPASGGDFEVAAPSRAPRPGLAPLVRAKTFAAEGWGRAGRSPPVP